MCFGQLHVSCEEAGNRRFCCEGGEGRGGSQQNKRPPPPAPPQGEGGGGSVGAGLGAAGAGARDAAIKATSEATANSANIFLAQAGERQDSTVPPPAAAAAAGPGAAGKDE